MDTQQPFTHRLNLIVDSSGFHVEETLTIHGQTTWPRERKLISFKSFGEAQDVLLELSNSTPDQFNEWLKAHNFIPWPVDELVKTQPFELPIILQQLTLDH